jgi:hypothetical protein
VAGQDAVTCHQRQAVSTRIQPAVVGNRDESRFAVDAEDVGSVATLDLPVLQRPTTLNFCPAVLRLFATHTILAKRKSRQRKKEISFSPTLQKAINLGGSSTVWWTATIFFAS